MKTAIMLGAIALAAVTPAQAGDFSWDGAYAGIQAARVSGKSIWSQDYPLKTNIRPGIHAGYNFQQGSLLLGGELSYTHGKVAEHGYPEYRYTRLWDAKLKIGYAPGRFALYGFAGRAFTRYDADGDHHTLKGNLYGAGIDYALTDTLSIGFESAKRHLRGRYDARITTNSLRLSYLF